MLTIKDVVAQLQSLISGEQTVDTVADWAARVHLQYETNQLEFETGREQLILDTLIDLIHNQDEPFRLDTQELRQRIDILGSLTSEKP